MKKVISIIFIGILLSCQNHDISVEEFNSLVSENDSLKAELDQYKLLPYIDNMKFTISKGETYSTNFLLIAKDAITVDSVRIKGVSPRKAMELITLKKEDLSTRLIFTSDSSGKFDIIAYAKVHPWGDKLIPLKFPITVEN